MHKMDVIKTFILCCIIFEKSWLGSSELIQDDFISFETRSGKSFEATMMTLSTDVILFKVKAKEEAKVKLNKPGDPENHVLITLGKEENTKCSIEKTGEPSVDFQIPDVLSDAEDRPFWITVEDSSIAFGEGEDAGNDKIGSIETSNAKELTVMSFATQDVTGRWTLKKYTAQNVNFKSSMAVDYNQFWKTSFEKKSIVFAVQACGEARVILSNETFNINGEDNHYEIVLGTINNTASLIRAIANQNPAPPALVQVQTPMIMSCTEPRTFWARWDFGVIEVGKGPEVGLEPIMSHTEIEKPSKIAGITAIGFTTSNGTDGDWRISNFGVNNFQVVTPSQGVETSVWMYEQAKSFEFYLRACDQAAVHLSRNALESLSVLTHGYRFEFGQFNYGIGIKKNPNEVVAKLEDFDALDCHIKKKFWISWTEHTLRVGMGELFQNEILSWREPDKEDIEGIKIVTLSTYSSKDIGIWEFPKHSGSDIIVRSDTKDTRDREKTRLDVTGMSEMTFKVTACEGIDLLLEDHIEGPFAEVILGAKDQPRNKIVDMQDNVLANSNDVVNLCDNSDWMWISWTATEFLLGQGPSIGHSVVLHWTRASNEVNSIAFSGLYEKALFEFTTFPNRIYEVRIPKSSPNPVADLSVYQNQFSFHVRSCSETVILLKEMPESTDDNSFFVIIGDFNDTSNATIYHGSMPDNKAVVQYPDLLDCYLPKPFWLSWKSTEIGFNVTLGIGDYSDEQTILEFAHNDNQTSINDVSLVGSTANDTDWIFHDDSAILSTFYTQPEFDMNQIVRRVAGVPGFLFKINASAEVHILLFEFYNSDEYYDIVIGGDENNTTQIYRNRSGTDPVKEISTPGILSTDKYDEFWVSWFGGIIEVGKGNIIGAFPLLVYEDPDPMTVAFLALSTGEGHEGYWQVHTLLAGTFLITTTSETSSDAINIELLPHLQYYGFAVRGCDHASVVLKDQEETSNVVYQIDIGIEDNTKTQITDSNGTIVAEAITPNILDCGMAKLFYLSWENGLLQLLNGNQKGKLVVEHIIGERSSDIHGISFSSQCHKPVDWIVSPLEDRVFGFNTSDALETNNYRTVWWDINYQTTFFNFEVSVKACSHAAIVLTTVPGQLHNDLVFEIVLGTETGRHEIRRGINGEVVAYDDANPDMLDCDEYRTFTITKTDTKLYIGQNHEPNTHTLMVYESNNSFTIGAMTVATQDPSGASWLLGEHPAGPEYSVKTAEHYDYDKTLLVPENPEFAFAVKACEDARILLQQNPFKSNDSEDTFAMEIIIGGSGNTQSQLSNYTDGVVLKSFNHTPLSCNESREFWISWEGHKYDVGSGPYVGQRTFLSYSSSLAHNPFVSVSLKSGSQVTAEWLWQREIGKLTWLGHEPSTTKQGSRSYHWVDTFGYRQAVFRIKACEDASIVLATFKENLDFLASEIQIGISGNNETALFTEIWGFPTIKEPTPSILSCDAFTTFWVNWNATSMSFGNGGIIGDEIIINHSSENAFQAIGAIGFGSSDITEVIYELTDLAGPTITMVMPRMSEVEKLERMVLTPSMDAFTFAVKSCTNAVIRLKKDGDSSPDFEIVFDDNFVTKMIKNPETSKAEVVASVDTYFLLDCNSYRHIWISWTSTVIRLGSGFTPGMFELLSYTDAEETTKTVLSMGSYGPNDQAWKLNFNIDDQYRFHTSEDYSTNPHISVLAVTSIVFRVKASKEAVLALSAAPGITDEETYEIILGHNENSLAVIRSKPSLTYEKLVEISGLLSGDESRPFWLRWDDCRVSVGKGQIVGKDEFLGYQIQDCHFTSLALATAEGVQGIWDVAFKEIPIPTTDPTSSTNQPTLQPTSSSTSTTTSFPSTVPTIPVTQGGLSGGQIAGIVIGVLLAIVILAVFAYMYLNHSKQKYLGGGNIVRFSDTMYHDEPVLEDGTDSNNQPTNGTLDFGAVFQELPSTLNIEEDGEEDKIQSFPVFEEKLSEAVEDDSQA